MNSENYGSTHNFLSEIRQSLLKTNYTDLTIAASTTSVIALMLLGSCIWCYAYYCKRRKSDKGNKAADDLLDSGHSSTTPSEGKVESFFSGWKSENNGGTEKPKMNGSNGKSKTGISKNIITPNKNIEFVIPTVSRVVFHVY